MRDLTILKKLTFVYDVGKPVWNANFSWIDCSGGIKL